MKFMRLLLLGITLAWPLVAVSSPAGAQKLADSIQSGRETVVAIDHDARRMACQDSTGRVRNYDVDASAVISSEGRKARAGLKVVSIGDIVVTQERGGKVYWISIVRRAWQAAESPGG